MDLKGKWVKHPTANKWAVKIDGWELPQVGAVVTVARRSGTTSSKTIVALVSRTKVGEWIVDVATDGMDISRPPARLKPRKLLIDQEAPLGPYEWHRRRRNLDKCQ